MSAHIRFLCPTCKFVMEAPLASAGNKIACLACGQRLQIPPAQRAKTILAPVVTIPTAQFAPPLATSAPTTVRVEIPILNTILRVLLWYYVLKFLVYLAKSTLKYLIVAVAAAIAGIWVAWMVTAPPRPYGLDRLDPYLEPLATMLRYQAPGIRARSIPGTPVQIQQP
jgi:hypothetical protein